MESASDLMQRLRPNSSTASMSSYSQGHFHKHSPGIPPPHPQLPPPSPPVSRAAALPPRKVHRRSHSDIPFGGAGFVKQESDLGRNAENVIDSCDDLFTAYMNLDSFEPLNSSGMEDKRENLDSRDSSENEAESSVNENPSMEKKEGTKRSASGDLIPVNSRHCRSISMDSFMDKLNFADESPKLPPLHSNSTDGEFSASEMKKIMANEKLAEMALADPKRVKRILANRQSAARSKERKTRYISELEHKVQILQTEATTLSAQLTLLQRDSAGLTNQNHELKFRLQAMEQQAQLRDALNEALTGEVQRLKVATGEISEAHLSKGLNRQSLLNSQMYQMQQLQIQQQQQPQQHQLQQSTNTSLYQMQSQQQHTQQNNSNEKLEKN
ncbi:bZIP transcription factor 29-like isoform X1 [Typha latifolia]|uniref:bZIP transcription factor 29-like isoform X1 n=1 Tax=Typha latifolia TaxID=4733 RepID=UPI003C2CEFB8